MFSSTFETLLVLLAVFVTAAAAGPVAGLWHYEVVHNSSMAPTLRAGGVAVVVPEPVGSVRVGQVIAFRPPGVRYVRIHRVVRVHRVTALSQRGEGIWVTTKGDANKAADPGPVRLEGATAYEEHLFVPYLGYAAAVLDDRWARAALEAGLLALLMGGGVYLARGARDTEQVDGEPAAWAGWPRPRPRPQPQGAYLAGERATTASMVALNQIYGAARGPDPTVIDPRTTEPRTGVAGTTEPRTTEPGTTEPRTTEPRTTEPRTGGAGTGGAGTGGAGGQETAAL
jgi:signal peptidase I